MSMKIYTRTGDEGETGLFGGGRVPKDHPRVAAYGDVDELNSVLGVVRATAAGAVLRRAARVGAARPVRHRRPPGHARSRARWPRRWRRRSLGRRADQPSSSGSWTTADEELPPLRAFVLPAGTPKAAALHLARTVCRRAERSVVHLAHDERRCPSLFLVYLNRLSDLLFTLARLANHRAGAGDVTW